MQANMFSFILKILLISAIISVGIKTLGPQLSIPPSTNIVLTFVLLPTVLMVLALGLQYRTNIIKS